jgi:hypothetical protein
MTSQERWETLLRGERLDRVPCFQFMLGHSALVCGQPLSMAFENAAVSFECQIHAQEMYGFDGGPIYGYASLGDGNSAARSSSPGTSTSAPLW